MTGKVILLLFVTANKQNTFQYVCIKGFQIIRNTSNILVSSSDSAATHLQNINSKAYKSGYCSSVSFQKLDNQKNEGEEGGVKEHEQLVSDSG